MSETEANNELRRMIELVDNGSMTDLARTFRDLPENDPYRSVLQVEMDRRDLLRGYPTD